MNSTTCLRLGGLSLLTAIFGPLRVDAQYLYQNYINPGYGGTAEYSAWDVFYSPNDFPNLPDAAAPFGSFGPASGAGFTDPTGSAWQPADPLAFWDNRNPTLTNSSGGAFIISPGFSGNVYSFSNGLQFEIKDSVSTPVESVLLQFGTAGTEVDFDAIRLRYDNGGGITELAPSQWVREFRGSGSSFGGNSNRNAIEWDLRGLGIQDYTLHFGSIGSSLSLQEVLLDTSSAYQSVVPNKGIFEGTTDATWSTASNWQSSAIVEPRGNVLLRGGSRLDAGTGAREVGLVQFDVSNDFEVDGSGLLTVNTGFTVNGSGLNHRVTQPIRTGGIQVVSIDNGSTLDLSGPVSGTFGFAKGGAGTLVLSANNAFGGSIVVSEGTVRVLGQNSGAPAVSILRGRFEMVSGADLGTGGPAIDLGADSDIFSFTGSNLAELTLTGALSLDRSIAVAEGSYDKRIRAQFTGSGASIEGDLIFAGTGSDLEIEVFDASDRLTVAGDFSMPNAARLIKNGAGRLTFAGSGNTRGSFLVNDGYFRLTETASIAASGSWTIGPDGSFGGDGAVAWRTGETMNVAGALVADGPGGGLELAPGSESSLIAGANPILRFDFREGPTAITFESLGAWIDGWERFTIELLLPDNFDYDLDRTLIHNLALANPDSIGGIQGYNTSLYSASLSDSGSGVLLSFASIPEPNTLGLWVGLLCATACLQRGRRKFRSQI